MGKKTIVISGTSRGIGLHIAKRFLEEGFKVIGISRSETPIQHVDFKQKLADLGNLDEIREFAKELDGEHIVGLINNAGMHGPIGPFEHLSFDRWLATFNLNILGTAALTQACIPYLRKTNGFIIFLSGGGSAFPRANFSAYGVSKCAVIRLSDTLSAELKPDVLVYCIAPGPNRTTLLEEAIQNGEQVDETDIVGFEFPENLCVFLAYNKDPKYSGKFIHVKDDYIGWGATALTEAAYTLRRIDPRTISDVDFS